MNMHFHDVQYTLIGSNPHFPTGINLKKPIAAGVASTRLMRVSTNDAPRRQLWFPH